jgi:hypothetical protein
MVLLLHSVFDSFFRSLSSRFTQADVEFAWLGSGASLTP